MVGAIERLPRQDDRYEGYYPNQRGPASFKHRTWRTTLGRNNWLDNSLVSDAQRGCVRMIRVEEFPVPRLSQ